MSRADILGRVRAALGRQAGQVTPDPPPARIRLPEVGREARISSLLDRVEALAGKGWQASTQAEALEMVTALLGNRSAVASNAPLLEQCGIARLAGVRSGITDRDQLRQLCATAEVGITCADYALADTGTLVMISSLQEARMISLLPPEHIAVVPSRRILSGLDELFSLVPQPASLSSSMVLITGPSRTADIEQILVRGVHGPGVLTVLVVEQTDECGV